MSSDEKHGDTDVNDTELQAKHRRVDALEASTDPPEATGNVEHRDPDTSDWIAETVSIAGDVSLGSETDQAVVPEGIADIYKRVRDCIAESGSGSEGEATGSKSSSAEASHTNDPQKPTDYRRFEKEYGEVRPPSFKSCDQLFRYALETCLRDGVEYAPRGNKVLEVPYPVVLRLTNVHRPFIESKIRRANYRFGMAEACWILGGSDDAKLIGEYNKQMLKFSDDGERMWGAYGPRLMGQLAHVVSTLKRDPDSRQAIVTTWRPQVEEVPNRTDEAIVAGGLQCLDWLADFPEWDGSSWRSKDIPCTVAWHFQIRDGRLNLSVFMRSHDVWLGLPYDVLSFTTVQRAVASMLGIEAGVYSHILSNLHLYASNVEAAEAVIREDDTPWYSVPELPKFGNLLRDWSPERVSLLFGDDILIGKDACKDIPCLGPFTAAINRRPELWAPWRDLMAANGRVRPVTK